MRICLVSHSFYPAFYYGGPISSTFDLSKNLASRGVHIYVSTTNANGNTKLDVDSQQFIELVPNLKVRYYDEQIIYYFSLDFIFNLWHDIKKSDIVYIQYIFHYTVFFALLYSFLLQKKIIICPRASLSLWGLKWKGYVSYLLKKLWVFLIIKPFSKNVFWQGCSSIEVKDIKRIFPEAKAYEISDGVNVNDFQIKNKLTNEELVFKYTEHKFSHVSDVIFSMGRLHKIKGFDILIDSFKLVLEERPNAKLLIAGPNDGYQSSIIKQINNLGLQESIFLIGILDHEKKTEVLYNSSLFALSSYVESFGIVILEALSCGTPVVVSNNTIWKNLETIGVGFNVENNKTSFSNALIKALSKKYESEDCIKFVKNNYDWKIITNRFTDLFNKINNE